MVHLVCLKVCILLNDKTTHNEMLVIYFHIDTAMEGHALFAFVQLSLHNTYATLSFTIKDSFIHGWLQDCKKHEKC